MLNKLMIAHAMQAHDNCDTPQTRAVWTIVRMRLERGMLVTEVIAQCRKRAEEARKVDRSETVARAWENGAFWLARWLEEAQSPQS